MPQVQYLYSGVIHPNQTKFYSRLLISFTVGQIQATGTPSRPVPSSTATRHLANLKLEADRLLHRSLAPSTQQAYSAALNKFHNFLVQFHFHPFWPVPVTQLLHYIGHLSLQNMSYRTVSLYLNAIAYKHKIHGLQDTTKCFIVTKTLEGLRRSAGVTKDIRIPISYELFCRITHSQPNVCRSAYESALFSAAFTITYYGLLRVSETIALQRSDITIVHHSLCQIIIQKSKTDQIGSSAKVDITPHHNSTLNPVATISQFLRLRDRVSRTGPLLAHLNTKPLTKYQFQAVLQKSLQFIGVSGHFRSHSFRIGMATELAKMGLSDSEIKAKGRWRSAAYLSYIRT